MSGHTHKASEPSRFGQTRGGITGLEGAGGRTPMSTGCLRKSRVVSRDWSRSPLTCPPECSMILCGSMSSRSTKEAVLGGPENMVCARRGLRFGSVLGAGVVGLGLLVLLVPLCARAPSCADLSPPPKWEGPNYKYFFTIRTRIISTSYNCEMYISPGFRREPPTPSLPTARCGQGPASGVGKQEVEHVERHEEPKVLCRPLGAPPSRG